MLADKYLWNDHTYLVVDLFENLEEQHPNIGSWYEIKQGLDQMLERGAVVLVQGLHAWLGCPRNREINEYLDCLQFS